MGFSRQEYWSGLPCPPPGDLPHPGIEPGSLTSPALADRFFTTSATWEPLMINAFQLIPHLILYSLIYFLLLFVLFPLLGRSGIHSFVFIISILFHCICSFWTSWLYNVFLYHCWKQDTIYFPYQDALYTLSSSLSPWLADFPRIPLLFLPPSLPENETFETFTPNPPHLPAFILNYTALGWDSGEFLTLHPC